MKIHNFFPLSIFQDQIQMSIDEKNNLINEIRKMKDLSKTPHGTDQALNNNERISISGDVIFLGKNSNLLEHLTPSFDNWKKL